MNEYILKVFCPESVASASITAGLEALQSHLNIHFTKMAFHDGQLKDVERLLPGVESGLQSGSFPAFSNGLNSNPVTFAGVKLQGPIAPAGETIWYFYCTFRSESEGMKGLMADFGAATEAIWGTLSSKAVETQTRLQQQNWVDAAQLNGLPRLADPPAFRSVHTPANFGWINYWSAATIADLQGGDFGRFEAYQKLDSGAAIAMVTQSNLDFKDANHLHRMVRLYESFPSVGGRAIPR
ncbi:MAG: DUF5953 family protein [Bacteroidota bacterium]